MPRNTKMYCMEVRKSSDSRKPTFQFSQPQHLYDVGKHLIACGYEIRRIYESKSWEERWATKTSEDRLREFAQSHDIDHK